VIVVQSDSHCTEDLRASTVHPPKLEKLDSLGLFKAVMPMGLWAPAYQYRIRQTGEILAFDLQTACRPHALSGPAPVLFVSKGVDSYFGNLVCRSERTEAPRQMQLTSALTMADGFSKMLAAGVSVE